MAERLVPTHRGVIPILLPKGNMEYIAVGNGSMNPFPTVFLFGLIYWVWNADNAFNLKIILLYVAFYVVILNRVKDLYRSFWGCIRVQFFVLLSP